MARYRRRAWMPHARRWVVIDLYTMRIVKRCFTRGGAALATAERDPSFMQYTFGRL